MKRDHNAQAVANAKIPIATIDCSSIGPLLSE